MELFDGAKYQLPRDVDIEWETTKEKFSIFLSEYKNLREKVGIPATPRIQETYSMIHREYVSPEVINDPLYKEFEYLHRLFIKGYLSINHPYKPEITDRRRNIILLRCFYSLSIITNFILKYLFSNSLGILFKELPFCMFYVKKQLLWWPMLSILLQITVIFSLILQENLTYKAIFGY
ncbi:hypothetical protein [Enterococcus mundtii]|uniref:Uncharacterized protein n=1 Tax=Enterococcus mundtii TaxID=53346 RepID=A0A242KFU1_ENTMU|nr:hypothetical protein [Enterococcus mundtii]OTP19927.1 hypothetical protein A5802_003331 [Enterococcus mundtii]